MTLSILKSSSYSLGTKAVEVVLSLALLAILARLLEPKDFGIFAIVLAVQSLLQPLIDMGLTQAYIKSNNPSEDLKRSFFTLNLAFGIFNIIVLFVLAPIISIVYENDLLFYLIIVFSISIIFTSISRQGYAQLTRDKRFDKLMNISLLSNIITFGVSVYFAYEGYGVWVFIIKAITLNIVNAIMIYYFTKSSYKITSWKTIKKFTSELKFGFEIFINRILNGVFNASDKFIFGKFFSIELLGHYSNSQQIARMADTHLRMPITGAIYSYLERYSSKDKKTFYDAFANIVFLITSTFSGLLLLEGDILLIYFLGDKWIFASEYMQIMGLFAMAMVMKGILTIISMSENSMKYQNKIDFASLGLLIFIFLSIYYFKLNIIYFVYIFSIIFFFYWLFFFTLEIQKHSNKGMKFIKNIFYLSLIITLLLYVRMFIDYELVCFFTIGIIYEITVFLMLIKEYKKFRSKI